MFITTANTKILLAEEEPMEMRRILFVIGTIWILFALVACEVDEQGKNSSEESKMSEGEGNYEEEEEISEEEKDRLLRRIDYALLGQGPYARRALKEYLICDADGDDVEELFVICGEKSSNKTLFALDYRDDGKPFGLCHANRSATGSSTFWIRSDGIPILESSFASTGAGTREEYSYWNGSTWEIFASSRAVYDFDAMQFGEEPVYISESAIFEDEELSIEAFKNRIEELNLRPFSAALNDLFTVAWPDVDIDAFVQEYESHLAQLECQEILRTEGDIDGDGEKEVLWCINDATFLWNYNMEYQDSFGPAPNEDVFFFSTGRGANLVIADTNKSGITIRTARLGQGAIESLKFEDGLLTFGYDQGKITQFLYSGVDKETGMFLITEYVPPEQSYLREGTWYEFSPHDEFVDVYHFLDFYRGYTTKRRTDTGEEILQDGESFWYTVSEDGRNITIRFNDGKENSYTYIPDSEYGSVLADDINYEVMPNGNVVSYQTIIWYYATSPTAKELAADRSKLSILIPIPD